MFRRQFQKRRAGQGVGQFSLYIRLVVRKLSAQADSDLPFQVILRVVNDPRAAEDDHATDVQRPVVFPAKALVIMRDNPGDWFYIKGFFIGEPVRESLTCLLGFFPDCLVG